MDATTESPDWPPRKWRCPVNCLYRVTIAEVLEHLDREHVDHPEHARWLELAHGIRDRERAQEEDLPLWGAATGERAGGRGEEESTQNGSAADAADATILDRLRANVANRHAAQAELAQLLAEGVRTDYITIADMARAAQISRDTVYRLLKVSDDATPSRKSHGKGARRPARHTQPRPHARA